jgi:metallo-beta-lactamase class B
VRRLLLAVFLIASAAFAQKSEIERAWNRPIEPFRIMGNLFYVGAADVTSYLIATPKGPEVEQAFEEALKKES